jgi:uncharacterized membrane protein YhfC
MNMLAFTYALNGLLMILMAIALGIFLTRRFKLGWRLWWMGAATFILSQVGHIPFNSLLTQLFERGLLPVPPESSKLIFNAVVLGLSAGLWEELARYATYRWWAKDARSWSTGLLLGAGHGGIEAILLGLLVLLGLVNMTILRTTPDIQSLVSPEQIPLVEQQLAAYWSAPWYVTLLGALERAFTLPFHLAASLLVLRTFIRGRVRWLWLAVSWHALLDAGAVYIVGTWGAYAAEVWIGMSAIINLGLIFALRQPEPEPAPAAVGEPVPPPATADEILPAIEENLENLENTRYN